MEMREALKRDWTSLPPKLLNLIGKKLTEISDFVRFRAVCPAWSSSTPITDLPPQFPWILESRHDLDEQNLRFYSISANKFYTIHSPKSVSNNIYGLIEGYLPVLENKQLSLLNPLSNHEISLPSYDLKSSSEISHWFMLQINFMGKSVIACRCCSPEYPKCKISFCSAGEDNWHVLNLATDYKRFNYFCLNVINDMLFFVKSDTGATDVIDITTGALAYVIPPVDSPATPETIDLVETSGDILRFSKHYDQFDNDWCDVHRLDVSKNGSPCWTKVTNIGNYAYFTDMKGGFILEANELARIKANSIYILDRIFLDHGRHIDRLRRIDIETGASELLPFPVTSPVGWFAPILHHH